MLYCKNNFKLTMRHIRFIFLASFFFSLHLALLAYLNSSMLSQFASASTISFVYTTASILSLILVSVAPSIIRSIGAFKYIIWTLILSTSLLYLISTHTGVSIIPFFILYFALNSAILYGLDLFIEHYSTESNTGNIRGTYLTLANLGWVAAPIISTSIQTAFGFSFIYLIAAFAVFASLLVLFFSQRGFVDKAYKKSSLREALRVLRQNKTIRIITGLNFLLQLFFVVMVIYSPVYLTSVIGFSWKALGILLTAMLLPFVIFPYPSGRLADKYLGEKELMCFGLLVIGASTLVFASLGVASLLAYAVVLFATRVGASVLETMCESAFFKHVTDEDSSVISVYRNMMPVAYTVGPLIAGAVFALSSYYILFISLGVLMTISVIFALQIKDTK